MTLLARGAGLRKMASAGLAKSAELEARENQTAAAIDQAKQAQEMNTLGTGAGFGAMYGMKSLAADKVGNIAAEGLSKTLTQNVSQGLSEKIAGDVTGKVATDLAVESGVTSVVAPATTAGAGAAGAGAAGGGAAGAGAAGAGAAGSGGTMAALSTIAAPVAIGLGVAYLLNKLFD